jgi:hypothetical protein
MSWTVLQVSMTHLAMPVYRIATGSKVRGSNPGGGDVALAVQKYSGAHPALRKMGKVHPRTCHEGPEGKKSCIYTLSLTSALDWVWWSKPHPLRFTIGENPVTILEEAG